MNARGYTLIIWDIGESQKAALLDLIHCGLKLSIPGTQRFVNEGSVLLAENNRVPDQLRQGTGVCEITAALTDEFCTKTNRQLFGIKAAAVPPHPHSDHGRMLGVLTTTADVELLTFWFQGKDDKHCADYQLIQATDRAVNIMKALPGEHLVVMVTSDSGFRGRVLSCIRQGFEVVVLYQDHLTSHKPEGLLGTTQKAYQWLPFLRDKLDMPHLRLSSYSETERYNTNTPRQPHQSRVPHPDPNPSFHSRGASQSQGLSAPSPARHLVALSGLQEGDWPVSVQSKKLLQAQFGLTVADKTSVTVQPSATGPLAILDFSRCDDIVEAATLVEVLDGMLWNESVLRARVWEDQLAVSGSSAPPRDFGAEAMNPRPFRHPVPPGPPSPPNNSRQLQASQGPHASGRPHRSAPPLGFRMPVRFPGSRHPVAHSQARACRPHEPHNSPCRPHHSSTAGPRAEAVLRRSDIPHQQMVHSAAISDAIAHFQWGFFNAFGSMTTYTDQECLHIEEQYRALRALPSAAQAQSELRHYYVVVEGNYCKIDLLLRLQGPLEDDAEGEHSDIQSGLRVWREMKN